MFNDERKAMKNQFLSGILACLLIPLLSFPAYADGSQLDKFFVELKNAKGLAEAQKIEGQIWMAWLKSGDEKVDELMQLAQRKRRGYDFNGAIEVLDEIIELKPDYAEAWNQRATVYFFQEEYEKSLEDIAKVLELEPRHFGSLAGRAIIRLRQLKPALARQNILEAMKYHPYLKERTLLPNL